MRINSKLLGALLALSFGHSSMAMAALNIFACEPEYGALAKELAPGAKIYTATTAMQDPHQVQARPSLIAKMRQADLVACAGADLEIGWLPMLQMKSANAAVREGSNGLFFGADQVEPLDKLANVDRSMGDVHAKGNPHLQFDPERMLKVARAFSDRLKQLDPEAAADYEAAHADFAARWQAATTRWQAQAGPLKGKKVIAYHTTFRYLFNWLRISQEADLEPKPGLPPTSGHLASLVERAKAGDILAIVVASYQDERGARWLSDKTGVPVLILPASVGANDQSQDLFGLYDNVLAQLLGGK
ncbi:zinc ABC transporter substrate-binding protein [Shewanella cyperi]|uniref:Zinc ABC transporter substrate-binding protein n=1 Tax=Shewanella cyperi TaxID=2814292 RepID=A0A975AKC1_9GAMM|nr:zinc ABC transporter substrate-binding protein [Shewanella cyperi]QSX29581.1 zinc ABC transporter substrate-binding protein [Shewanella cyperi]